MPPLSQIRPTTQEILKVQNSNFHLDAVLGNPLVSSRSRWHDPEWRLDNDTPGATNFKSLITWSFEMPDGTSFMDGQWTKQRECWKRLAWSMFRDFRCGKNFKAGSASVISYSFKHFIRWMAKRAYIDFSELDETAEQMFLDDLMGEVELDGEDDEVEQEFKSPIYNRDVGLAYGTIKQKIQVWNYLWQQSTVLIEQQIKPLVRKPFDGETVDKLCSKIITEVIGQTPKLPDEVASPIMEAAYRLIGRPADDVIVVQSRYLAAYASGAGRVRSTRQRKGHRLLETLQFLTLPDEHKSWFVMPSKSSETDSDGRNNGFLSVFALRAAIMDIRNACVIVIQSVSGVRINEICGIQAGENAVTKFPSCIEIRPSKTGLNELFYLKGYLAKTEESPKQVEWLIGSRPRGSQACPMPVRALQVLQTLFQPWRSMAGPQTIRNAMLVSFAVGIGLPKSVRMIQKITASLLLMGQKDFVKRYVDLSALPSQSKDGEDLNRYRESYGTCLRTHQWRKTFALYIFQIDSRLLPAIAQQFKHLSLAMTEQGYLGSDPTLIETFNSVRLQKTVQFFQEAATGKKLVSGRFSEALKRYRGALQEITYDMDTSSATRAVTHWVLENDLRIWFADHGKCFIGVSPQMARCHEVAGTSSWKNSEPNYSTREANICLGCPCYAIDGEHAVFWTRRYVENMSAWNKVKGSGERAEFRVIRERAQQAAGVLKVLKINLPDIGKPNAA